jgi:mutator protein MutT
MDEKCFIKKVLNRQLKMKTFKYCPRCGSINFVPDTWRSFKCRDCGFHFYINSSAAVAAIIVNEKNELLLTKRAFEPDKGMLDLPGGFVDPGETAENALIREIKEELNLDIVELSYYISFPNEYPFSGLIVNTIDLAFICKVKDFSNIRIADDVADYVFVTKDNIDYSKIGGSSIKKIVSQFLEYHTPSSFSL